MLEDGLTQVRVKTGGDVVLSNASRVKDMMENSNSRCSIMSLVIVTSGVHHVLSNSNSRCSIMSLVIVTQGCEAVA